MKDLIRYFSQRTLLTNVVLFGLIFAAVALWPRVGKEEMPEFAMNFLRVNILYPGASAEDVELFVTRPIEEELKGVSGLREVVSTSSFSSSSFRITMEPDLPNEDEVVQEIKDAVDRARLPLETEDPEYSRFSSREKAIIDIALYHTGSEMLNVEQRAELQKYALAFESQMLTLPEITSLERSGYLQPELHILVQPENLKRYNIPLSTVREQVLSQHVRQPVGTLEDREESEITALSELEDPESLKKVVLRSGFEGNKVRLGQVADVKPGFADSKTILKVQGHEAVIFNVRKNAAVDILSAQKVVSQFVDRFKSSNRSAPIGVALMDDESYDVRNRLSLIGYNGLIGFVLIVLVLLVFMDFKSGIWVAAGIPFTLAFTLLASMVIGFTINNVTLAAIIIVLGIVVDDAIIVAENISRLHRQGMSLKDAVVEGTAKVMSPVVASILTTCAAFLPLYFFSGRFGMFVKYMPSIIFLMLAASLIESFFILPSHMGQRFPRLGVFRRTEQKDVEGSGHWFFEWENQYSRVLRRFLAWRGFVLLGFAAFAAGAFALYQTQLKFVMFPREEAKELTVKAVGPEKLTRKEMARFVKPLEDLFLEDETGSVLSVYTRIGQSRRGGQVRENEASLRIELTAPSERDISLNRLIARWEEQIKPLGGFQEVRFMRSRFGSESGSPIELEVRENNDAQRQLLAERLLREMQTVAALKNVEIEKPVTRPEYTLKMDLDEMIRLGIDPNSVATSLRAYVEGQILYTLNKGDEEVDVRLTSRKENKSKIEDILDLRAANARDYLVPFRSVVSVKAGTKPANIPRTNYKRATKIYADITEGSSRTPLEIAEQLEREVFPRIMQDYPTSVLKFRGEIEDSRESAGDFMTSLFLVLGLIYLLLVILYDSLALPLLIAAVIPFGAAGVIVAFWGHGMDKYGFFAVVGTLGMIGVIVNDAIVMIAKLEEELTSAHTRGELFDQVAAISSTRLRAVVLTTLTTVAGLFPTAYGLAGYDSMLAEMMLAMGWGLLFATTVTLILVPCLYSFYSELRWKFQSKSAKGIA